VISWSSAGWVLILTGIAGVLLPYLLPQRVQRRVIRSGGAGRMPMGWTFRRRPSPSLATVPPPAVATSEVIATEEAAPAGRAPAPAEEVVEEIYEE